MGKSSLLPKRDGQPRTLKICSTSGVDAGHWYSPAAVEEMLAADMADAARFRWLDAVALSVDMVADPDNLVQVWHETLSGHATTGRTLREAVDEAMKRHNVEAKRAPRVNLRSDDGRRED